MKKILLLCALFFSTLMAEERVMQSILDNVLLKNINSAMSKTQALNADVLKAPQSKLQDEFKSMILDWKKVETFYIAAQMNEDSVDIPRYIDVFHNLKENLHEQMQHVIESKESLDIAMYKNSFKTVNALEYVLFKGELTQRKRAMAKMMLENIVSRLAEIKTVYQTDTKRFLSDFKWTNDVIINELIDSSFKLRDWRVGDMAGLSRKYKGKPDSRRAEYFLSQNSKATIESIIRTHEQVMNSSQYDFGDMLKEKGYAKEVDFIVSKINESIENLKYIQNENFETKDVATLYKSLDELHKAYYISLVNAVGIDTKILDADGD